MNHFGETKKFSDILTCRIDSFHSQIGETKISGTIGEEILYGTLREIGFYVKHGNPNSHTQGKDIVLLEPHIDISCKSGILKNKRVNISSHRTTTYTKIEDKLNFLRKKHQDYVFCLVEIGKGKYYFVVFNDNDLSFGEMNGKKCKGGYEAKENGIHAKIVAGTSDQLGYSVPLDLAIYKSVVGSGCNNRFSR